MLRRWLLALVLALTLPLRSFADGLDFVEFRFHKNVSPHPKDGNFSQNWKAPGEPLTEQEKAALQVMQDIVQNDVFVKGMLRSANERMQRLRAGGPLKGQAGKSFEVAKSGKIVIVLNENIKVKQRTNYATFDRGGGGLDPMIHLSVGDVRDLHGSTDDARRKLADSLLHESDHVDTFFAEFLSDRMVFKKGGLSSSGQAHKFWTVSNDQLAFIEGKAEAAQLWAYETDSKLITDRVIVKDDVFNASIHGIRRPDLPYERPDLAGLMEQEHLGLADIGEAFSLLNEKYKGGPIPESEVLPLLAKQEVTSGVSATGLRLKMMSEQFSTEGVVALVLRDLYRNSVVHPTEVTRLVEKNGVRSLPQLIEHLKTQKFAGDREMIAQVDMLVNRNTLGAHLDERGARVLFEERMAARIDDETFRSKIDEAFLKQYPDVGPKLVRENPPVAKLDPAFFNDAPVVKPSGTASGTPPVVAEPVPETIARPAERVRARLAQGGSRLMLHAGNSMAMALSVSVLMSTMSDVIKGKASVTDLGEIMKNARRQLTDPQFVTMTVAGTLVQEGAEKVGEKALINLLTSRGTQMAARQACAKLKVGGVVVSIVAGLIANQVLAHDWSFLKCPNMSRGDKAKRIFKVIFTDFSGWDKKAVLDVVLGTVGFAAAAAIVVASGGSALVVMGVGIVVGFAATYVSGWIAHAIDALQYRHIKETVQWALQEYAKPDPKVSFPTGQIFWLKLDSEDKTKLEEANGVEEKRRALAEALGKIGDIGTEKFTCEGNVIEKTHGVQNGVFKEFFEKRRIFMNDTVGELNDYTQAHQKKVEEATQDYIKATAPTSGGMDVRRLTLLFAFDRRYRPLEPETIADMIVAAARIDPKLESDPGAQETATDDQIDALHARYLETVRSVLHADPDLIKSEHVRLVNEMEQESQAAYERFTDQRHEWETDVKTKIAKFVKELEDKIAEEKADLDAMDLTPIQPYNADLIAYIQDHRTQLEGMVRGYKEMYHLQETAPDTPPDEGMQAYLDDLEDFEAKPEDL